MRTTVKSESYRIEEAFEMWFYQRMMRIKWFDKVWNEKVLSLGGEKLRLRQDLNTGAGLEDHYVL